METFKYVDCDEIFEEKDKPIEKIEKLLHTEISEDDSPPEAQKVDVNEEVAAADPTCYKETENIYEMVQESHSSGSGDQPPVPTQVDNELGMALPIQSEKRKRRDHQNIIEGVKFQLILDENTKIDANGVTYIKRTKTRKIDEYFVIQATTTIIDKGQTEERKHDTKVNCEDRQEFESVWDEKWVPAEGDQHVTHPIIFPEPALNKLDMPESNNNSEVGSILEEDRNGPANIEYETQTSSDVGERPALTAQRNLEDKPGNPHDVERGQQRNVDVTEKKLDGSARGLENEKDQRYVEVTERSLDQQRKADIAENHLRETRLAFDHEEQKKEQSHLSKDMQRISKMRQDSLRASRSTDNVYESVDSYSLSSGDTNESSLSRMDKFNASAHSEHIRETKMALPLKVDKLKKRDHRNIMENKTFRLILEEETFVDAEGVTYVIESKTRSIHDVVVATGKTVITQEDGSSKTQEHEVQMGVIQGQEIIRMNAHNLVDFDNIWDEHWVPAKKGVHSGIFPEKGLSEEMFGN